MASFSSTLRVFACLLLIFPVGRRAPAQDSRPASAPAAIAGEAHLAPRDPAAHRAFIEMVRRIHPDRGSKAADYGDIATLHEEVRELADSFADDEPASAARLLEVWGFTCSERLHEPDAALACLEAAVEIASEGGQASMVANLYASRGGILLDLGRLEKALVDVRRARELFRKLGDEHGLANTEVNLANAYSDTSRMDEALDLYASALARYEKLGLAREMADTGVNRAFCLLSLRRFDEALADLERAELGYRRAENDAGIARCLICRGSICNQTGRPREALAAFDRAEPLISPESPSRTALIENRANALQLLGRYRESLAAFAEAEARHVARGHVRNLAGLRTNVGLTLIRLGLFDEALSSFDRARSDFRGHPDAVAERAIAHNRGIALIELGRHEEALVELGRADDAARTLTGAESPAIAADRARALVGLGRRDEAERLYARNMKTFEARGDRTRLAHTRQNAARLLLGDPSRHGEALELLELAEARYVETGDRIELAGVRTNRGRVHRAAGRPREALISYGRGADALEAALRNGILTLGAGATAAVRSRLEALAPETLDCLAELHRPAPDDVARAYRVVQVILGLGTACLLGGDARPVRAARVAAAVADRWALVEYAFGSDRLVAFVITRDGVEAVKLGEAAPVIRDAEILSHLLRGGTEPAANLLRRMGARLVDPVLERLRGNPDVMLIAPGGVLASVPFEALRVVSRKGGKGESGDVACIAERDIAYVHSGSAMLAMREVAREGAADEDVLDYAALAFSGREGELARTETEVLDVARLFSSDGAERAAIVRARRTKDGAKNASYDIVSGRRLRVLLRDAATESALRDPAVSSARILHLACHAEADRAAPAFTHLALAPDEGRTGSDGTLWFGELADLDLDNRLLVLSACETGAGARNEVDGVQSLSRAGLAAGAHSVLSTLWPVEDSAAHRMVSGFFEHRIREGSSRIRALADAKREALDAGDPVRSWAAWVLFDVSEG